MKVKANWFLNDSDKITLKRIKTLLTQFYRVLSAAIHDNAPLSICMSSNAIEHIKYNENGILLPAITNGYITVSTPSRLFFYVFIALNYYNSLLNFVKDGTVSKSSGNLRFTHYFTRMIFSKQEQQMANTTFLSEISRIFPVIQIQTNSILMANIDTLRDPWRCHRANYQNTWRDLFLAVGGFIGSI